MYRHEHALKEAFQASMFESTKLMGYCHSAAPAVLTVRRRQQEGEARMALLGYPAPTGDRRPRMARRWLGAQLVELGGRLVGGPRAVGRTDRSPTAQAVGTR